MEPCLNHINAKPDLLATSDLLCFFNYIPSPENSEVYGRVWKDRKEQGRKRRSDILS